MSDECFVKVQGEEAVPMSRTTKATCGGRRADRLRDAQEE